jgi:hypothetical protein
MRSLHGYIRKIVQQEVRVQLNILLFGRKNGPRKAQRTGVMESRQVGLTTTKRKAEKKKDMRLLKVAS